MGIENIDLELLGEIFREAGIKSAEVFGSYARGSATEGSDLDLIVEFEGDNTTLFDLIALENRISDLLKLDVDLLTEAALSPYIANLIERRVIYGKKG